MRALRPVGSSIPLFSSDATDVLDLTCDGAYQVRLTSSGTAALGLALAYAKARGGPRNTALLPAYGCPDLIAAASFAGLESCFVDLQPQTPWLATEFAGERLDSAAALVAVNFLGMRERLEALGEIARRTGIPLIEDSAQMMPFAGGSKPTGDLVVFSFGRGKPLSLLNGGALLVRRDWASDFDARMPSTPESATSGARYALQSLAHNLAIHPLVFHWVRRLSFLKIGEVAYYPLESAEERGAEFLQRIAGAHQRAAKSPTAVQQAIAARLVDCKHLVDLPGSIGRAGFPLLRYPVLAPDRVMRDRIVTELDRAGLGASRFYGSALTQLPGLPAVTLQRAPHAEQFAARLFTLPVHADVRASDVDRMFEMLGNG